MHITAVPLGSTCDCNSSKLIQSGIRRGVLSERLSFARSALLVLLLVVDVLAIYPQQRWPRVPLRDLFLPLARLRPPLLLPIRSWSSSVPPCFSWLSPAVLLPFQHSHPEAIVAHPIGYANFPHLHVIGSSASSSSSSPLLSPALRSKADALFLLLLSSYGIATS